MTDHLAQAELLLREGDPKNALVSLTQAVKASPANARLRVFLAQLLAVLGQWERAHTQLNVMAELMPSSQPMREMMGYALRCELIRLETFQGKRAPMVFGQPESWLAMLIESLMQHGRGEQALSEDLATRAFAEAPVTTGDIDGERFEWLADADSRLGPVLEAFVNGRYYWIPFDRLRAIRLEAPQDLRDTVWMPAYLTFANGGEVVAMIPTRYPGSHGSEDPLIQLARKTEWREIGTDRYIGLGQRVLATDAGDHDLLSVRHIAFDAVDAG
jgi:type VI secretion system protein ImpE